MAASEKRKIGEMWNEVRRGLMCYNFGMMGHLARYCRRNGSARRKAERQGVRQRRREHDERYWKERCRQIWRIQGRIFGRTERLGIPRDGAGRAARSDTSHQNVDGEDADKASNNLNQKKMEKSEVRGS